MKFVSIKFWNFYQISELKWKLLVIAFGKYVTSHGLQQTLTSLSISRILEVKWIIFSFSSWRSDFLFLILLSFDKKILFPAIFILKFSFSARVGTFWFDFAERERFWGLWKKFTFLFLLSKLEKRIYFDKFDSVWIDHLGRSQQTMAIKQMENYDTVLKGANIKIPKKATDNVIKSNKCNQCDYASSWAGNFRAHLKRTVEILHWRKVKQMQPMWLCLF